MGIPATTAVTYLTVAEGTAFKNVSGSSDDPMPAGSSTWLSLLVGHSETACCCTDGYFYIDGLYFPGEKGDPVLKNDKPKFCDHINPAFGGTVVGGHVLGRGCRSACRNRRRRVFAAHLPDAQHLPV